MGLLKSTTLFYDALPYMDRVANQLMNSLRYQGYQIDGVKLPSGDWDISIKKGSLFKAVLGMQTALKVTMSAAAPHVYVKLGIGIFGQQAIPTALTLCVWWPFAIPQIWGLIQQHKFDKEVLNALQASFNAVAGHTITSKKID